MKNEIIMKPGFKVAKRFIFKQHKFLEVHNLDGCFNEISTLGCSDYNCYRLHFNSCIGVWKPKGSQSAIPKQQ